MSKRKLLVLGGKPIGSCELVRAAQDQGFYVVVADYLPVAASPAKQIADASWELSTADLGALKQRCIEERIDGVLSGVHEFNLRKMAALSEMLELPCYCTEAQQDLCDDKPRFKEACREAGLAVSGEYTEAEAYDLPLSAYPLAVKPRDGSGSRGFTKCETPEALAEAISFAKEHSFCGEALIEEFVDSDALIVQYTAHEGNIYFCGLTDKASQKMGAEGAPIMSLQIAPSVHTQEYLDTTDEKMRCLLASLDMKEGPIWLELFYAGGKFIVNEIGYRFGGSLTYHLVRELYGVDQLELEISHAMGDKGEDLQVKPCFDGVYAIWPLHLHAGKIAQISGIDQLPNLPEHIALVQVHYVGDEIADWGSAQQVFAYVHLKGENIPALLDSMKSILDSIQVVDSDGNDMLFSLFDPRDNESLSCFVDRPLDAAC